MQTFPPIAPKAATPSQSDLALRQVAQELEASFLAEMLKSSGLGKAGGSFTGGAGEDQFSSFLVDEQAKQIVAAGGLGLAESIFESLKEQRNAE
ncbi:MAG: rod-binding protein [Pseudomonadota bacterium]